MPGMAIVDDLLQSPGLYLGIDRDATGGGEAAARILLTPLPGRSGVALDYETFNANPDRVRGHHEHAVLARRSPSRCPNRGTCFMPGGMAHLVRRPWSGTGPSSVFSPRPNTTSPA